MRGFFFNIPVHLSNTLMCAIFNIVVTKETNSNVFSVKLNLILLYRNINYFTTTNVPPRGKTDNVVSDQLRHKPACTSTEKSKKLEISDLRRRGIVLSD